MTQEDRQFDGEVGGGVSCYLLITAFVIFAYNYMDMHLLASNSGASYTGAIGMEECGSQCISHDMT